MIWLSIVYHICVVIATLFTSKGGRKMYSKFVELLQKNNVTPYQVSKATGISQSSLSDWKTGRAKPKADKLLILANYFGVTVDYFLKEKTP